MTTTPHDIPHSYNFGQALDHLLQINKMTQSHLGSITGLAVSEISGTKTGRILLARHHVDAIAIATNCSASSLEAAWDRSKVAREGAPARKYKRGAVKKRAKKLPTSKSRPATASVAAGSHPSHADTWADLAVVLPKRGEYVWVVNETQPDLKSIRLTRGVLNEFAEYTHWLLLNEPNF